MSERSVTSARRFVERRHRGAVLPEVPADCIVAHRDVVAHAARALGSVTIDIGGQRPHLLAFVRPEGRRPYGVVDGCIGAPAAAALVEELAAYGFSRLWCAGAAGHPTERLPATVQIGDLVVASDAVSYEGTSLHYTSGGPLFAADRAMSDALEAAARAASPRVTRGRVATTDAIYRETPAFLRDVLAHDAVALDMEASAVFAVAGALGLAAAALFVITDVVPAAGEWVVDFDDARIGVADAHLFPVLRAAMEAV